MFVSLRCVVRLLDSERRLLAWTEVEGEARGDGAVWAPAPFSALAEHTGVALSIDVHWVDLNVHFATPVAPMLVTQGETITMAWPQPMFMVRGSAEPLPPVTVRHSVTIGVPTGGVGVIG